MSDLRDRTIPVAVTADEKLRFLDEAKRAGVSVSTFARGLLFRDGAARSPGGARSVVRLAVLTQAAAALSELSEKTERLVEPAQALDLAISLLRVERALMAVALPGAIRNGAPDHDPEIEDEWASEGDPE